MDDVSHQGMKTLLGGALEFALEVALSPSLLILATLLCFPPTLCALSILSLRAFHWAFVPFALYPTLRECFVEFFLLLILYRS